LLRARYQLAAKPSRALSTLSTTTFASADALPRSFAADVVRAHAFLDLGRPDEAERVASTGLRRVSDSPGAEAFGFNKSNLLLSQGLALTRLGRVKDAVAPLNEALAWREANLDKSSPALAESMIALAECYLSGADRGPARALVERAQAIHRSHPNLGEHLRSPLHKLEEQLSAR